MTAARVRRRAKKVPEAQWVYNLAGMLQVSMVGYAVGGAFLSLAYFDLPYNVLVILVACDRWMAEERWRTDTVGVLGSVATLGRKPPRPAPAAPSSSTAGPAALHPELPAGTWSAGTGKAGRPARDG